MKKTFISPVGDHMDDLFIAIKDFSVEKVVLVTPEKNMGIAQNTIKDLEKFRIPAEIKKINGNIWEEMFRAVSEIKEIYKEKNVIVHTSTGDRQTTCAATSAAFVNGLKAIAVDGNEAMVLPILKFSYYKLLTDKKMQILKLLYKNEDFCVSLEELSKKTKMSLPLISYHINGNLKSQGLKEFGLIETQERKARTAIKLTPLARMLIKGHITS